MTKKSRNEERRGIRRVLQMVDRVLSHQPQEMLTTDGSGLMTWGEIRQHLQAAAKCELLIRPYK